MHASGSLAGASGQCRATCPAYGWKGSGSRMSENMKDVDHMQKRLESGAFSWCVHGRHFSGPFKYMGVVAVLRGVRRREVGNSRRPPIASGLRYGFRPIDGLYSPCRRRGFSEYCCKHLWRMRNTGNRRFLRYDAYRNLTGRRPSTRSSTREKRSAARTYVLQRCLQQ